MSLVFLLGCVGGGSPVARAQSTPSDTTVQAEVTADRDGFRIRSSDGRYALRLRGDVQVDGRFFPEGAPAPGASTFALRRVRTRFDGTLDGRIRFRTMVDFGRGNARLQDAFVDLRLTDAATLRAGRFKMPVGLEFIQSPAYLFLPERAYPSDVVPRRDVGVMLHGTAGRVTYAAGLVNGAVDGGSGLRDVDAGKDVVGRVYGEPFADGTPLHGAGLGVAATYGLHRGTAATSGLPSFASRGGQTVFAYRDGARADGRLARVTPQAFVPVGPVRVMAEVAWTSTQVRAAEASEALTHAAWQAAASVVLTGEDATFGRLVPRRPFAPERGQWGAVELAARVQQLRLDAATSPTYAPSDAADRVTAWGVGVNWTLTATTRLALALERTHAPTPSGEDPLDGETFIISRVQVVF